MQNSNWRMSDWQQRGLSGVRMRSSQRRVQRRFVSAISAMTLLALVLLLSACTTQPQQPCEMPQFPMRPALSEQLPLVTYSEQWRLLVEQSRKKLTGTP